MDNASVSLLSQDERIEGGFRSAVCLHGHTMHSEECLSFLPTYLSYVPGVSQFVRRRQRNGVDFARAYWTPPLTPASALRLEREQIAGLGLRPIVSLTDHDNIDAGMALQVTASRADTPISVEWTVPYRRTIFHLGVHNLPPEDAREWMSTMNMYTLSHSEDLLLEILRELAAIPEVLIVLNHPYWLEEGVEEADHRLALPRILRACGEWLHAIELNGTRRWPENQAAMELAREWRKPVVSGGDRHATEPSACLNLTNARSFDEFAAEVRDGESSIVFLPHYEEPMTLRLIDACWDVLRPYPEYPGRERWTDRVFYRGEDGVARPLSTVWADGTPWLVRPASALIQFVMSSSLRPALRYLLAGRTEVRS